MINENILYWFLLIKKMNFSGAAHGHPYVNSLSQERLAVVPSSSLGSNTAAGFLAKGLSLGPGCPEFFSKPPG